MKIYRTLLCTRPFQNYLQFAQIYLFQYLEFKKKTHTILCLIILHNLLSLNVIANTLVISVVNYFKLDLRLQQINRFRLGYWPLTEKA